MIGAYNNAIAQERVVSGKVTAADDNSALPGVNIKVKGTETGTVTDIEGNYKISASENAALIFSFMGYATQEIKVGSRSVIDVKLKEDAKALSEVIVVGYGTQTKRELIGSISKVEGAKIMETPVPSFEAALQGKAAGVQVVQGSGIAGSGSVIRIRGLGSVSAGGDPLYVIDGIPVTQDPFMRKNSGAVNLNPLASINPNDIESVEILKDAAAAGIYGSRGANGVILITTKRGKSGKPSFNYSSRFGVSEPVAKAQMMNSAEYLQMRQEAYENDGGVGRVPLPNDVTWEQALATDTDWWNETAGIGFKHEHNFSMNQGTDKLKTFAGFSYSDNGSYLIGNSFERISGRVNVDYKLLNNLDVSLSSSLSRSTNNRIDAAWSGGLGRAMSDALPIYPVDDPEFWETRSRWLNPVLARDNKEMKTLDTRTINSLNFTYKPLERLSIKVGGGLDYMDLEDYVFETGYLLEADHAGKTEGNFRRVTNFNLVGTMEYDVAMPTGHKLKLMAGNEFQKSSTSGAGYSLTDVDKPLYRNAVMGELGARQDNQPIEGELWSFISYFGRLNYAYKEKYIVQGTARTDGSSRFGANNKFGFFPTLALGWLVSEEAFLKNNSTISLLKLKAAYGITGNSNLPNYQWIGTATKQRNATYNGYSYQYVTRIHNPDLKWETSTNMDVGIELGFLQDRFTAEFSAYNRATRDVFMEVLAPKQAGISDRAWVNSGEILNQGLEFALTSRNLTGAFQWTTNFNIARNYNELVSIGNYSEEAVSGGSNDTRAVVGQPVGTNFLVRYAGVDPETGRPMYLDKDGNITYDWNPANRVPVGNVLPDFVGGITNTFEYKNFDLSFLFVFTKGGNIFDSSSKRQLGVVSEWNMRRDLFDRWRSPGDQATYPRLTLDTETYGAGTPWINTDLWLHDASFVRLRSLSLGYNIPAELTSRIGLKNAKVVFSGFNLLTFTKFPGLDPEIARDFENTTDRNMSVNITYLTPPQERSFNLGVNITF